MKPLYPLPSWAASHYSFIGSIAGCDVWHGSSLMSPYAIVGDTIGTGSEFFGCSYGPKELERRAKGMTPGNVFPMEVYEFCLAHHNLSH